MSDAKQNLQENLKKLEKGLYLMSQDRIRALSVHETVELIEELRDVVKSAQSNVAGL